MVWRSGDVMIVNNVSKIEIFQSLDEVNKEYENNLDLFVESVWVKPVRQVSVNRFGDTLVVKYKNKIYHIKIGRQEEQNPFNPASTYEISECTKAQYYPKQWTVKVKFPDRYLVKTINDEQGVVNTLMSYEAMKKFNVRMTILSLNKPGVLLGQDHRRRLRSCCWHAHRDWMIALYDINPNVIIQTRMARYKNREHFHETYPGTEYILTDRCHCEYS